MSIEQGFQALPFLLAIAIWLLKKVRERVDASSRAERGEPEFQRDYEPIEVYGPKRTRRIG